MLVPVLLAALLGAVVLLIIAVRDVESALRRGLYDIESHLEGIVEILRERADDALYDYDEHAD